MTQLKREAIRAGIVEKFQSELKDTKDKMAGANRFFAIAEKLQSDIWENNSTNAPLCKALLFATHTACQGIDEDLVDDEKITKKFGKTLKAELKEIPDQKFSI